MELIGPVRKVDIVHRNRDAPSKPFDYSKKSIMPWSLQRDLRNPMLRTHRIFPSTEPTTLRASHPLVEGQEYSLQLEEESAQVVMVATSSL